MATKRGWSDDVLDLIKGLGKKEFQAADLYAREAELAALHPNNKNVRPKIRQQLDLLRKANVLEFVPPKMYRLR
jgi:type II restriction enzyme